MKRLISITLVLLLLLTIVSGCNSAKVNSEGEFIVSDNSAEIEKMESEWEEIISSIELKPSLVSHYPNPVTNPDEFLEMYNLGFASVTYIIDYVIENNVNSRNGSFLMMAAANNLHLNSLPGQIGANAVNPIYSKDEDAYSPVWYAKQLKKYAQEAPAKVEEICDSDIEMEEKMLKLEQYGMLAVPTLQKRIESGEKEWKECVLVLTLSKLSTKERFEVLSYAFEDETLYAKDSKNLIHEKKLEAIGKKKFDTDWFEENSKELAIMSEIFK